MSLKENCVLWIIKLNIMRNYRKRELWLVSLILWLGLGMSFAAEPRYLNIVFVGNSITYGAGLEEPRREAPPVRAAIYLKRSADVQVVRYSNQGVSGNTTVDFLPATETYFNKVREAADQFRDETWATLLFSIMLGTNDSAIRGTNGCPVAPETYRENLRQIIDRLLPCIQMPVSSCTVRSGIARILTTAPCTCKRDSIASRPIIPSWSRWLRNMGNVFPVRSFWAIRKAMIISGQTPKSCFRRRMATPESSICTRISEARSLWASYGARL